jgi:threonine/homoserine/homoserine lactone efflux protein
MIDSMLAFAAVAALVAITPGLDTMLVLRTALVSGRRAALAAGAGIGLGCLVWAMASALGITTLLAASRLGYDLLRWAGAAYLCVLGARTIWSTRPGRRRSGRVEPDGTEAGVVASGFVDSGVVEAGVVDSGVVEAGVVGGFGRARSAGGAFRTGLSTNLLNPKVGVFYLSMLPQFLPHGVAPLLASTAMAMIHNVEGMIWFTLITVLVTRASTLFTRPAVRRWLDRVTGTVFIGFGVRLALENGRR